MANPPLQLGPCMLYLGDCRQVMADLPPASVDAIVTDPPYGLEFMGREWDSAWKYEIAGHGFSDGADRRPAPNFVSSRNPMCLRCHRHKRGWKDTPGCQCTEPAFDDADHRARDMELFQDWCATWAAPLLRVAKPGAVLLAFGGTRTFHRLTSALEDAGWEVRDCLVWLYGSGFPKSMDIGKAIDKAARGVPQGGPDPTSPNHGRCKGGCSAENPTGRGFGAGPGAFMREAGGDQGRNLAGESLPWNGWGTALKPAWEPIVLAMKSLSGTFADNAERWGVAGLNIDGSRIEVHDADYSRNCSGDRGHADNRKRDLAFAMGCGRASGVGRWPANVMLSEEAARMLDAQTGTLTSGTGAVKKATSAGYRANAYGAESRPLGTPNIEYGDSGGASRFFYCAKASKAERGPGNDHPTVKPLRLMEYLCRLTKTPTGGVVLDPFMGSGTTALACLAEGRPFIGIEKDAHNFDIARRRIEAALRTPEKQHVG